QRIYDSSGYELSFHKAGCIETCKVFIYQPSMDLQKIKTSENKPFKKRFPKTSENEKKTKNNVVVFY
ncbi:MAG: hypothetical protein AABX03_02200, partial [Nanoarchaeota archaeon]